MNLQRESEMDFDEFLDAAMEPVEVCWHLYPASEALKKLDPERYSGLFEVWSKSGADLEPKLRLVK